MIPHADTSPELRSRALRPREIRLLFRLASSVAPLPTVVEIGSWKGRSTVVLARALASRGGGVVHAIDPHQGGLEHTPGADTFDEFVGNVKRKGVAHLVRAHRASSLEVARGWSEPAGMVWVDGSHEYEDVRADLEAWLPHLVSGGVLAMHDTTNLPGPGRAADELLFDGSAFCRHGLTDSIAFAQRTIGAGRAADRARARAVRLVRRVVSAGTRLKPLLPRWAVSPLRALSVRARGVTARRVGGPVLREGGRRLAGRPRLLFVVPLPPPFGGVEAACRALLESPLRERFSIVVVNGNIRASNRTRGRLDLEGVVGTLGLCVRLAAAVVRTRPRAVFTTLSMSRTGLLKDAAVILSARALGRQVVAHYHQNELFPAFVTTLPGLMRRLVRYVLGQLRLLLVLGRDIAPALAGFVRADRIRVLPNGIVLGSLPPRPAGNGAEDEHRAEVTVLYLGDVSFRKGFADLAPVFRRLHRRFPSVRLRFAGEIVLPRDESFFRPEYLPEALRDRFAAAEGVITEFLAHTAEQGAQYLGLLVGDRKWAELAAADIFVLPSYSEGLSMAVLEAMAMGVPVVTTRVGAMRDVVEDGVSGYLIERGDVATLEDRLATLVADSDLRRRFGRAGRVLVAERFDSLRVAKHLGALLDEVIGSAAAAPAPGTGCTGE